MEECEECEECVESAVERLAKAFLRYLGKSVDGMEAGYRVNDFFINLGFRGCLSDSERELFPQALGWLVENGYLNVKNGNHYFITQKGINVMYWIHGIP